MALKIGWFLDGGGCRAAAVEVAQARALAEFCNGQGIAIENISLAGMSLGGILAAFLAQSRAWDEIFVYLDILDEILNKFNATGPEAIFDVTNKRVFIDSRHRNSILEPSRLYELIDGKTFHTKPIDPKRIIDSPIPLHLYTTNLKTHAQDCFTTRQQHIMARPSILRDVIAATASLRPFFPPILIDGVRHCDGARINLGSLIKTGCDIIFVLLAEPRPKDFTEMVNNWSWWPWIPEIFEYMGAVGTGMDKSELRLVKKKAEEKKYDIKTLELANEVSKTLTALHHLPDKKQQVRDELGKLLDRLLYRVGDRHVAYPIPLYSPALPRTLRVESFAPKQVEPNDIRDKTTGALIKKKDTVIYEGDLKKVHRETYEFAKKFLSQVDMDSPEAVQIF